MLAYVNNSNVTEIYGLFANEDYSYIHRSVSILLVCCLLLLFSVLYNWVFSTVSLILTFERESEVDTNF